MLGVDGVVIEDRDLVVVQTWHHHLKDRKHFDFELPIVIWPIRPRLEGPVDHLISSVYPHGHRQMAG